MNRLICLSLLLLLGCGGTGAPSPTSSSATTPTPSASAQVTSAAQAAALVFASDARFGYVGPVNPSFISCCWYEATEAAGGYNVTIELGWGDCESGCISHHKWLFQVDPDGAIEKLDEAGDEPVQMEFVAGQGPAHVFAQLRAGPVCPVEPAPPPANCDPRPIAGAEVVLRSPVGVELARAVSDESGQIEFALPQGAYYVEPQQVEGLLGTAQPAAFSVLEDSFLTLSLDYDTGIR